MKEKSTHQEIGKDHLPWLISHLLKAAVVPKSQKLKPRCRYSLSQLMQNEAIYSVSFNDIIHEYRPPLRSQGGFNAFLNSSWGPVKYLDV